MKIIKPYAEIISPVKIDGYQVLRHIELCGRVCYKSEDAISIESAVAFVQKIIKRGHESVLEHYSVTVRFVCDRGVSHELVRHRIASFSQESTRYCNYGNSDDGCTFIRPRFWYLDEGTDMEKQKRSIWEREMYAAEISYLRLLEMGAAPQEARSVLPNSLKTEVIMTANLREWRHFFRLRTSISAHPQMREITIPLLWQFYDFIPIVFDDIKVAVEAGR